MTGRRKMVCNHRVGDFFEVRGEELFFPPGQTFSLYALAAILPLLPAKQRRTHASDWMTIDEEVACPDPRCGAVFRITRTGTRVFDRDQVTAVPGGITNQQAKGKSGHGKAKRG